MKLRPRLAGVLQSVARPVLRQVRSRYPGILRTVGLPTGIHETIDDWAKEAKTNLIVLNSEERVELVAALPRFLPEQAHPGFPGHIPYSDIRTYVAVVNDARVTGRNGYVLDAAGKILADIPRVYRANYTPQTHSLLSAVTPPIVEPLTGVSAALAIFSTGNYYHWLFEALPRLELLRQAGFDFAGIDWFVVNEIENQFVQQSLAYFGIPAHKLRVCRDGHAWRCETLLVPSMPGRTNPSRWICDFLRKNLLSPAPSITRERIFVSRSPQVRRRLANESEIDKTLATRGFRKVYLETCTLEEQVALFAGAEAVVAVHGASMANLVFCAPGTKVIELFNPDYVNACYWGVARQVDLEYGYLLSAGTFAGTVQNVEFCGDDLHVRASDLERLLVEFEL